MSFQNGQIQIQKSNDINLNTLNRVVHTSGGIQANIVEYGSTINLEIYTTNKRQKEY